MSIIMGQAIVPANSTVQVFLLPPGTVNTTFWQPTPATTQVYLGTSPRLTTVNGLLLTATPVNAESYVTSAGTPVYATTGNATAATFQYIISGGS